MSKRKNEIYRGDSKAHVDARLKLAGTIRGGDFVLPNGTIMPLSVARKAAQSVPVTASADALRRVLEALPKPAPKQGYAPGHKAEHRGEGGFRR